MAVDLGGQFGMLDTQLNIMTTLFHDSFNGSGTLVGHVTDSGGTWLDAHPEWADDPLVKLTLGGGVLSVPTNITYFDIAPSVAPTTDFRFEAVATLGSALAPSNSIDFYVWWGKDGAGDARSQAVFSFYNFNSTNLLMCGANVNQRGSSYADDISGSPGTYTFVVQRIAGEVKLFVNSINILTVLNNPLELADITLYTQLSATFPSSHPVFSIDDVLMLSVSSLSPSPEGSLFISGWV